MDPLSLQELCCSTLVSGMDLADYLLRFSQFLPKLSMETMMRMAVKWRKEIVFLTLLKEWPHEELNLSGIKFLDQWWAQRICKALEEQSKNSKLKMLDVSFCPLGTRGMEVLLKLFKPNEEHGDGPNLFQSFLRMLPLNFIPDNTEPKQTVLVKLRIDLCVDEVNYDVALDVLRDSQMLQIISFIVEALCPAKILQLLPYMKNEDLVKVDLNMNGLRGGGASSVFMALSREFHNLKYLDISYNAINESSSDGISALKKLLNCQKALAYLDLSANRMGCRMSDVLSSIVSSNLTFLKLSCCGMKGAELRKLAQLEFIPVLRELQIDGNCLSRHLDQLKYLLDRIGKDKGALRLLNLRHGRLKSHEFDQLLPLLKNLKCLDHLLVDDMAVPELSHVQSYLPGVEILIDADL